MRWLAIRMHTFDSKARDLHVHYARKRAFPNANMSSLHILADSGNAIDNSWLAQLKMVKDYMFTVAPFTNMV